MSLSFLENLRRKTEFRLTLWYAVFFICCALLLFGLGYVALWNSIRNHDHQLVTQKLEAYTRIIERSGLSALVQELEHGRSQNERGGFFVRVVSKDSLILSQTLPLPWHARQAELRGQALPFVEHQWELIENSGHGLHDHGDDLDVTGRLLRDGTILQVGYSTKARQQYLGLYKTIFIAVLGPLIIFGIAVGFFLARRALKPVRDLTQATISIRGGQMAERVPLGRTDTELRELALQFNEMMDGIEALTSGMREALDNVAHDLRTPLTHILFSIESAIERDVDRAALQEALQDCAEESRYILRMLNTLMDISEAETGIMRLDLAAINLGELMGAIYEIYLYDAEDKGLSLNFDIPADLMLQADAVRLRQAIANLVDNAIKYTPAGGAVSVTARASAAGVSIAVSDSGSGIKPEDLPRIFERLYRSDKSRSQRGLGLGLCLVKAIASAHHGSITVQNRPAGGAVFTLSLPRIPLLPLAGPDSGATGPCTLEC